MKLSKGASIKLKKDGDDLSKVTVGCSWGEKVTMRTLMLWSFF